MKLNCPSCSALLNVPESMLNKLMACPKCQSKFVASAALAVPDGTVAKPVATPAGKIIPGSSDYEMSTDEKPVENAGPEHLRWKICPNCGGPWKGGSESCPKCYFNARVNRCIPPIKKPLVSFRIDFQKFYLLIAAAALGVGIYFLILNWNTIRGWVGGFLNTK